MKTAYIGIGSNLGNPEENCLEAVDRIGWIPSCKVARVSGMYRTEPAGVDGQEWFANCVAEISTGISAKRLMERLLAIEKDMGRVREGGRWQARIIDLDILLFGIELIHEDNLTVPHPLMHRRRFVMVPMVDLAPDLIHPSLGKSMSELLQEIPGDGQDVKPLGGR
ncbi:MAG TPA: 2-amino-4-hydroxy-6-hydroxymethyldihydropteridine diphosphokinase [Desulfatiglandales bacterium]|nr:2-amino-4-hydroxy-6-hydroxymethyldihydropteridine diphosphokinase [Desulfatiglandales bacterium]